MCLCQTGTVELSLGGSELQPDGGAWELLPLQRKSGGNYIFCRTYQISTVQVWSCREDLEVWGREGRVTCSLTLLCAASPFMQRYCTQHTTLHSPAIYNISPQLAAQRLTSPPLSVSLIFTGSCPAAAPPALPCTRWASPPSSCPTSPASP